MNDVAAKMAKACEAKDIEGFQSALLEITDLNPPDASSSPIIEVLYHDWREGLEVLQNHASWDKNWKLGKGNASMFSFTVMAGSPNCCLKILEDPVDLTELDERGRNLLRMASESQSSDFAPVIQKLVGLGLDLDLPCKKGLSARDILFPPSSARLKRPDREIWHLAVQAGISEWERSALQQQTPSPIPPTQPRARRSL